MHDSELLRRYTLDRAGIMFVTDLIRDMLTFVTLRWNTIVPEMNVINKINMFGSWKNATMRQWWFGSVTALVMSLLISYKYLKYESMVNKKNKNMY